MYKVVFIPGPTANCGVYNALKALIPGLGKVFELQGLRGQEKAKDRRRKKKGGATSIPEPPQNQGNPDVSLLYSVSDLSLACVEIRSRYVVTLTILHG